MNTKKILVFLFLAAACQTADVKPQEGKADDYIVFGHFYGECFGERCVEIYKLTDSTLYEDTKDVYPLSGKVYVGNFVELDPAVFEKVKNLRDSIPTDLLLSIDSPYIGMPDASDGGGIYFEIRHAGVSRYWFIDKMTDYIPKDLRPFVKTVEREITLINN